MKNIVAACILTVFIQICLPMTVLADSAGIPRFSLVEGEVMLNDGETGEWVPAALNTPLHEGDGIWCPDAARAEIQLATGARVRLDHGSRLEILSLDEGFIQLHLSRGRMFVRTSASKEQNLQIDADDTTVLPFGRTRLRIDMRDNSEEDVSIFKGAAYVEGGGNRTRVRAGEQIALEDGRAELLPLNSPDEWERWNSERDSRIKSTSASEGYLPDELKPYGSDFDSSGSWVRVEEYGMVWQPTVVAVDWAPYRFGRWVWLRGDYVWLSHENWGWVPHHYGRWVSHASHGWLWVPPRRGDVHWSPGFVGWFSYGSSVGWVPLAPGETYYGYGSYGSFSVNLGAPAAGATPPPKNYRNIRHGTFIRQNDFLKGKTVIHQVPPESLPPGGALAGRPRLQPLPETRMPQVRSTPVRLPPPVRVTAPEQRSRFPRVTPQAAVPTRQAVPAPQERQVLPSGRQLQSSPPPAPSSTPAISPPQKEKRVVFPVQQPAATAVVPGRPAPAQVQPPVQRDRKVWRVKSKEGAAEEKQERKEQRQEQRQERKEQEQHERRH